MDEALGTRDRIRFDYWSDPLCIWACVSQPRLDNLLVEKGDLLEVCHRVVVVFDSVPWRFKEGPWKDTGPKGRATVTRKIAEKFGRHDIDGQVWLDDPPASSWGPGAAIRAVFGAEQGGDAPQGSGARYEKALRDSMFVGNRNIARRTVQLEVAEACGLDSAAVEERLEDGSALAALSEDQRLKQALGIQGSPTYVFDHGRASLYGNFNEGILHATVDELIRAEGLGCSAC